MQRNEQAEFPRLCKRNTRWALLKQRGHFTGDKQHVATMFLLF